MRISLGDDDFKNAFLSDKLVIDCTEIKLTQNDTDHPRIYTASGFMEISPKDGVKIRMVCHRSPLDPYDPMEYWNNFFKNTWYSLEAIDVYGRTWIHPNVLPIKNNFEKFIVMILNIDEIKVKILNNKSNNFVKFIFLEELAFPMNAHKKITTEVDNLKNVAFDSYSKGSIPNIKISYRKALKTHNEAYSEFLAEYKDSYKPPIDFEHRLLESIYFCTGAVSTPLISEFHNNENSIIELRKFKSLNTNNHIRKPLSSTNETDKYFFNLFERYFNYISINSDKGKNSFLHNKISVLLSITNEIFTSTVILVLCITVESILKEKIFNNIGRSNTATNKLHALKEAGAINDDDLQVWKRMRNDSAHGSFDIYSKEWHDMVNDIDIVVTLIHKLVFMCIGYNGEYSTYTKGHVGAAYFKHIEYNEALNKKYKNQSSNKS